SSRRRHTCLSRDWSSDVCSSDLYLVLPPAVLVTAMAAHQRYFPVVGPEGRLLPYFLAVSNGDPDRADAIVKGHERVLAARLADRSEERRRGKECGGRGGAESGQL